MASRAAAARPLLAALAENCGVLPGYFDWRGEWRLTGEDDRAAILCAMGLDASSEAAAGRALDEFRKARAEDEVVAVLDRRLARVPLSPPPGAWPLGSWECTLAGREEEHGGAFAVEAALVVADGSCHVRLTTTSEVPVGYYDAEISFDLHGMRQALSFFLLAPPALSPHVRQRSGRARQLGISANLYTLRSELNWGIGDLGDARRLASAMAERGVGWLGLNPLHATPSGSDEVSPYFPASRIFSSWLYLDVREVPELAEDAALLAEIDRGELATGIARCRAARYVDYGEIARLKRRALSSLHRKFRAAAATGPRADAFRAFRRREGEMLVRHATYEALAAELPAASRHGADWREWPPGYQDCAAAEVKAFAREHDEQIEFQTWLQFELDRQLGLARDGLALGLLLDLAVGTAPGGSEVWSERSLFATGAVLGAPPDDYSAVGQSWGVAPLVPHRLKRQRFRHFRRILRANLRHAGALRIDHAMGLLRQYWVTDEGAGRGGAYVGFPAAEMFAVVAIESWRAGAVVIAEDLGTVPEGFRDALAERGWLRTQVLYFERTRGGEYEPPGAYEALALATPSTHDQAPLLGFVGGRDLELRAHGGSLGADVSLEEALTERTREVAALRRRLAADGGLEADGDWPLALCAAAARMLARSRACLVGIALDDLGGEEDPVNVPGLTAAAAPLWSRRMRLDATAILRDPRVSAVLQEVSAKMDEPVLES